MIIPEWCTRTTDCIRQYRHRGDCVTPVTVLTDVLTRGATVNLIEGQPPSERRQRADAWLSRAVSAYNDERYPKAAAAAAIAQAYSVTADSRDIEAARYAAREGEVAPSRG